MSLTYCLSQFALVDASVSLLLNGVAHTKGDVAPLVMRRLGVAVIPIERLARLCSKTKLAPPQYDTRVRLDESSFTRDASTSTIVIFALRQMDWYPGGSPGNSTTCIAEGDSWESHRYAVSVI